MLYRVQHGRVGRMSKSMAAFLRTTARKDFLDIMIESGLFGSRKEARAALGAVCASLRAWMIAMTADPPQRVMSRLTVPGVGAFRIGWYEYGKYSPKVMIRFRPTKTVRDNLERHNQAAYRNWCKTQQSSKTPPKNPPCNAPQATISDSPVS